MEDPPDNWAQLAGASIVVKTEWLDDGNCDDHLEESDSVEINQEPHQGYLTQLIVTNALPPNIPSPVGEPRMDAHQQHDTQADLDPQLFGWHKKWSTKRKKYQCTKSTSLDYRKARLFEVGGERLDAGMLTLLKDWGVQMTPEDNKEFKKTYSCLACNLAFSSRHTLVRHRIATHGEQKHACQLCDYRTGYLTELVKHEKHAHSTGKQCGQCGYRAATSRRFEQHMEAHLNEFSCDQCTFKARHKNTLMNHMRRHTHCKVPSTVLNKNI